MDRRKFLETAGLLTAASAGASLLGGCSSGDPLLADARVDVKESYRCQLLVVGGGPAGVCAAVAAARQGIRTLLIDSGNCLGGMGTKGLVGPFMTCYDAKGERMIIRGLFEEVVDRLVAIGGALHPSGIRQGTEFTAWISEGHDHCTPFDPELLKVVYDHLCKEAGVKVLYHANFVRPIMKGKRICGAVLLTPSGLEAARADMVIDATGDGTVAYRAGAPCVFGDPENGRVQPASLFFRMNNVDTDALVAEVVPHLPEFRRVNGVSYRCLHWRVAEAEAAGKWDIARKSVNIYKCVRDDEWAVNCSRVTNIDATDSASMTAGEMAGRKQVEQLMQFFHEFVPGCENATLMSSGSILGIRESRHVKGEHVLEAGELIDSVVPDDSILVASNSVDVHGGGKSALSTTYTTIKGNWYGVPYRSLVPVEVDGLLLAGRCLSATSDAAGAVRVMPPAMAMGHAAGVAAALAVKGGLAPRNTDPEAIRKELLAQKAFLG